MGTYIPQPLFYIQLLSQNGMVCEQILYDQNRQETKQKRDAVLDCCCPTASDSGPALFQRLMSATKACG